MWLYVDGKAINLDHVTGTEAVTCDRLGTYGPVRADGVRVYFADHRVVDIYGRPAEGLVRTLRHLADRTLGLLEEDVDRKIVSELVEAMRDEKRKGA